MKLAGPNTINIFRLIMSLTVLMSILLQPVAEGISAFTDIEIELTILDTEKEQDEEQKKKNDTKDEKIETSVQAHRLAGYFHLSSRTNFKVQTQLWDFAIEIPIPPPQGGIA